MAPKCWFVVIVWVWLLRVMLAVMPTEAQREHCPSARCGGISISDPFWLTDTVTGRSCGPPDFEVTCFNETPILRSSIPFGLGFGITEISYEDRTLRVVDLGKRDAIRCQDPTPLSLNTSSKLGMPFKVSPAADLLILYNCTKAAAAEAAALGLEDKTPLVEMRCGKNESNAFARIGGRYNSSESYEGYHVEGCVSTLLPVLGTSSGEAANASDYERLINGGFLLTWDVPLPPLPFGGKLTCPSVKPSFNQAGVPLAK